MPRAIPASIEILPKQVLDSADLPELLTSGVRVYLPDVGGDTFGATVLAARRLTDLGQIVVPHIAARRLASQAQLDDRIKALTQEAGVRDVLVIGGDPNPPAGEFSSSLEMLETGIFDRYGVADIGIAGHPEGNVNMADDVACAALELKAAFRERTDARLRIVTQFGFDATRFIDWSEGLGMHGIDLPVHLGVAGPAKITTLVKYAAMCGVGNSVSFLKKRAGSIRTLLTGFSPDEIVGPIEQHIASHPDSAIRQVHVFPFGGLKPASAWLKGRGSWEREAQHPLTRIA